LIWWPLQGQIYATVASISRNYIWLWLVNECDELQAGEPNLKRDGLPRTTMVARISVALFAGL